MAEQRVVIPMLFKYEKIIPKSFLHLIRVKNRVETVSILSYVMLLELDLDYLDNV